MTNNKKKNKPAPKFTFCSTSDLLFKNTDNSSVTSFIFLAKLATFSLNRFTTYLLTFTFTVTFQKISSQTAIQSQKSHHVIIMWPCVIPVSNKEVKQLILVSNGWRSIRKRGFQIKITCIKSDETPLTWQMVNYSRTATSLRRTTSIRLFIATG